MARPKIKSVTDQRPFIMVYHDFLDSDVIGSHEKMVFIALKKFADSKNQCFPSLKKLSDVTGLSKRKIQDTLKELEEKHIITIESRLRYDGGTTSNLYTLHDYAEIWKVGSSEEIENVKKSKFVNLCEVSTELLLKELERRTKEKELDVEPTKAQQQALEFNQFDVVNTTTNLQKSQEVERYSLEQICILYDYDVMISDNPYQKHDIDSVMSILHTNLNTTKPTIRIGGEDKPSMVVIGKLMKLTYSGIIYAIEKFKEQTERIKNPTSYMLTLLYNAEEQRNLDIQNQVSYDMANWNLPTEE